MAALQELSLVCRGREYNPNSPGSFRSQQHRTARYQRSLPTKNLAKARSAWGRALAPSKYFSRDSTLLKAALKLIHELKKGTGARIILATTDDLKEGRMSWIEASYRPS